MTPTEIDARLLRAWPLPEAHGAADKEARGSLLLVAGSREIPGAAILAAEAAFRAGAGKVTIATAHSLAQSLALAVPEARVIGLPETPQDGFDIAGLDLLGACAARCDAALVGPGMVDAPATVAFVRGLLAQLGHVPVILDALAMDVALGDVRFTQPVLLTPHAGEMAHLTGAAKEQLQNDGESAAAQLAARTGATVVLKGAATFIADAGGNAWRHESHNPGLGISGSGDVLAGVMGGLLARGAALEQAAAWAVALHAAAGAALATSQGPLGFLARELAAQVPAAMHRAAGSR